MKCAELVRFSDMPGVAQAGLYPIVKCYMYQ